MRALFTAATGMEAQQARIDTIANNIANVGTTGFKKSRAEFQDLFYETLRAPGSTSSDGAVLPTGVQVGHGVQLSAVNTIYSAGDRVATGNQLDMAIDGLGFFQVQRPTGETVYTRDGTFKLDGDGNVVTAQGYQLIPAITIPSDAISITILPDGTVNVQAGRARRRRRIWARSNWHDLLTPPAFVWQVGICSRRVRLRVTLRWERRIRTGLGVSRRVSSKVRMSKSQKNSFR